MADTAYSQRSFLFEQSKHQNLAVVARCRSNRIFYQSPPVKESNKKRGCPKKYGERFDLGDAETWHFPDETSLIVQATCKGRIFFVFACFSRQSCI